MTTSNQPEQPLFDPDKYHMLSITYKNDSDKSVTICIQTMNLEDAVEAFNTWYLGRWAKYDHVTDERYDLPSDDCTVRNMVKFHTELELLSDLKTGEVYQCDDKYPFDLGIEYSIEVM